MVYTDSFKAKMVQRMSAPNPMSAMSLSKEVGVSQSQLSRWLRTAHTLGPMKKERSLEPVLQSGSSRLTAEKLRIVMAEKDPALVALLDDRVWRAGRAPFRASA